MQTVFPNSEFELFYKKFAKQYAHPLIFTSLLSHEIIPNVGIISYVKLGKKYLLHFGDPICDPLDYEAAFDYFINLAGKKKCHPIFFLASHEFAKTCSEKGYHCNNIGSTAFLDMNKYKWTGKMNRNANHVEKMGVRVRQVVIDSPTHPDYIKLSKFNKNWLSLQKQKKELFLAVGRFEEIFLKEHILFIAEDDEKIHGYISTHPYYENEKIKGQFLDINRRDHQTFKRGITELLIRNSSKYFFDKGIKEYSMGWMPLDINTEFFSYSKTARLIFKETFRHINFVYSFKNISSFKKNYYPYYEHNFLIFPNNIVTIGFCYLIFKNIGFSFYPLHWIKRYFNKKPLDKL